MEVGSTSHISSTDSNYERPAMGTSSARGHKSIRFMQTVRGKWEEAGGWDLKDPGSCSETVNRRGQMTGKRTYSFGACNYDGQVGKHMHPAESSQEFAKAELEESSTMKIYNRSDCVVTDE
jgi:hypothetical protein